MNITEQRNIKKLQAVIKIPTKNDAVGITSAAPLI